MNTYFARTIRLALLGLFATLILVPGLAQAQCGVPANCTIPNQILVCPTGDIVTSVVIRDAANVPCAGATITMSINQNCICAVATTITATTNAGGIASYRPMAGGCCSAPGLVTFTDASGVVLGSTPFINSPDMNADCLVNLTDLTSFSTLFFAGGGGRCADFNGDGIINLVDIVVLSGHFGH